MISVSGEGLFHPPPVLINLYGVPGTHNVGLPTQCRFNVGSALQPIAGSMPVNHIRRWPNIETEAGDCPLFVLTAIGVTRYAPKGHYPDNTIHWPNCDIILGHRLRRWAASFQPKPFNLLTTNIIVNMFFLKTF